MLTITVGVVAISIAGGGAHVVATWTAGEQSASLDVDLAAASGTVTWTDQDGISSRSTQVADAGSTWT